MPRVNPEILRWARDTAGLSQEEAAAKLQIREIRGRSAAERLTALESGEEEPTRPMIVRMSEKYRRPLLTFYLSAPPRRGERGQDFRTLPQGHTEADDALLDALIRNILARQSMVRAELEEEEEAEPLSFVGSMTMSDGVPAVIESIKQTLSINLNDFRSQPSALEAFALLRSKAERAGAFVLLKGDLGSYHTAIDLQTFRGFAIADGFAPFVVINDQDSNKAWSFSLLHELAHLWLGQTGVSGERGNLSIEQFCNDVAGEFLLPRVELLQYEFGNLMDIDTSQMRITEFAWERNLSSSMVAYKLYRIGAIGEEHWRLLSEAFHKRWLEERQRKRDLGRQRRTGPDFYTVRQHRIGRGLIELVEHMLKAGSITTSKAGKMLGVKAKQVQTLIDHSGRSSIRMPA